MSIALVPDPAVVERAYRRCEEITTQEARNFSYGIKLLPPPKRRALSAVYAFARRVDDIGDSAEPDEVRLAGLAGVRAQLHDLEAAGSDPVLIALADTARRTGLPLSAFDELIDGCEADVEGKQYRTFDDLRWYCRCVAGSIGRLSLAVFSDLDPAADPELAQRLADTLGLALQLTNILRDILEDRRIGRIYLPQDDLDQFGCTFALDDAGMLADDEDAVIALIEFEAARAEDAYAEGLRLLPMLDRRSRACCGAMAGIYHRLLHRIMAQPWHVLRTRMSLPGWEKAIVAGQALAGVGGR